jgi:hypothetical protein
LGEEVRRWFAAPLKHDRFKMSEWVQLVTKIQLPVLSYETVVSLVEALTASVAKADWPKVFEQLFTLDRRGVTRHAGIEDARQSLGRAQVDASVRLRAALGTDHIQHMEAEYAKVKTFLNPDDRQAWSQCIVIKKGLMDLAACRLPHTSGKVDDHNMYFATATTNEALTRLQRMIVDTKHFKERGAGSVTQPTADALNACCASGDEVMSDVTKWLTALSGQIFAVPLPFDDAVVYASWRDRVSEVCASGLALPLPPGASLDELSKEIAKVTDVSAQLSVPNVDNNRVATCMMKLAGMNPKYHDKGSIETKLESLVAVVVGNIDAVATSSIVANDAEKLSSVAHQCKLLREVCLPAFIRVFLFDLLAKFLTSRGG